MCVSQSHFLGNFFHVNVVREVFPHKLSSLVYLVCFRIILINLLLAFGIYIANYKGHKSCQLLLMRRLFGIGHLHSLAEGVAYGVADAYP